ncbi:hypothetical protein BBJ28_00008605 [Nothophytophthora sp. Chile5]|nr:hypothetical protein BBJ28_00008605 [Nothophytophthora sp. Chile5]
MAARVTKLFLQNCAQYAPANAGASGANKRSASKRPVAKRPLSGPSAAAASKKGGSAKRKQQQRSKKVTAGKSKERFLEAARRELDQADRTRENVRKLKTKTSVKSQRVMAKCVLGGEGFMAPLSCTFTFTTSSKSWKSS